MTRYTVSEDVFNTILENYKRKLVITQNFEDYVHGYSDKDKIFVDDNGFLIITILKLRTIVNMYLDDRDWLQVICECNEKQKEPIVKDISGLIAYERLVKFLKMWYNKEEIENILSKDWMEGKKLIPQMHFVHLSKDKIERFDNCYKYDINGAHAFVLSLMFPLAAKGIAEKYAQRKKDPEIKKVFNYSVGWFKHLGYDAAYNFIRTSVSEIMEETIKGIGGKILYINTDGFIVQNPLFELNSSNYLGDFKEEYHGTVYMYSTTNYWVYQTEQETKGSAMCCIRKLIDLPNGKVVRYNKTFGENGLCEATNIEEVNLWERKTTTE